jgi:hypothetical protein
MKSKIEQKMTRDEETLLFYYIIGRAITSGAMIEDQLINIVFESLEGRGNRNQIRASYQTIENFKSKLAFIDALLKSKPLPKLEISNWDRLRDRISKNSLKRNKLAHYMVSGDGRTEQAGSRIRLMPMRSRLNEDGEDISDILYIKDVANMHSDFFSLTFTIENFRCRLKGEREMFNKSAETPGRAQNLTDIAAYLTKPDQHPAPSAEAQY